ncbi:MAG: hypothetical protein F9B45_29265 [Phycisphaera sp. RhM]|nr:hypothetical protein [Phycisphaera sp. RhM]
MEHRSKLDGPLDPSRGLLLTFILLAWSSYAGACNIPVFRYALERWTPDDCEVIVFHDQPLSPADAIVMTRLQASTDDHGGHANAKVIAVDVSGDTNRQRVALWKEIGADTQKATLPHVLVRTKLGRGRFVNHWHGALADADRLRIFHSPIRTELRDRLLAGHSVVWLLIRSADHEKNTNAKQLVQQTFETLSSKVTLPEGIGLPGSELYADLPLVVKFSLLEIDPEDPKESFLVGLLSGLRLPDFEAGEPLLVPVFGRGRALEVIPARDLSARLMEELTVFLSGACSCQVKEQNPGFDLLIDADWDGQLFGEIDNRPPDRSAEEGRNRNPVLVPIPQGRK